MAHTFWRSRGSFARGGAVDDTHETRANLHLECQISGGIFFPTREARKQVRKGGVLWLELRTTGSSASEPSRWCPPRILHGGGLVTTSSKFRSTNRGLGGGLFSVGVDTSSRDHNACRSGGWHEGVLLRHPGSTRDGETRTFGGCSGGDLFSTGVVTCSRDRTTCGSGGWHEDVLLRHAGSTRDGETRTISDGGGWDTSTGGDALDNVRGELLGG